MKAAARLLDVSAIGLSGLCVVHCLILPLAAVALPMLGAFAEAEWLHLAFIAAAAPLAALSLVDWRGRRTAWPRVAVAAAGLTLMTAGALGWPDHAWETPLTVVGGVLLASAHAANLARRHRR